LRPRLTVLSGWIVATLDGALVGVAALALQEKLQPFSAAEATNGSCVSCHAVSSDPPPLGRAAAVVGNRRHVLDDAHVEARGLEAAKRGLAASARPLHVDLDVTHAELRRLAAGRP